MSDSCFYTHKQQCITLIGIAGSGKSTLGKLLSQSLSWAHVDTDNILEAWWGTNLQSIHDHLGVEDFLLAEEKIILDLKLNRCVISTGGSAIYSQAAMNYLKTLGPVIYLQANIQTILNRVQDVSTRGLVMKKGQTLEELYLERLPLYEQYADFVVKTDEYSPQRCVQFTKDWLKKWLKK